MLVRFVLAAFLCSLLYPIHYSYASGSLVGFENTAANGENFHYSDEGEIESVEIGYDSKSCGLICSYDGLAYLTVRKTCDFKPDCTYTKRIRVWFDDQDDAEKFVDMYSTRGGALDFYYDFHNGTFNGESKWKECGAFSIAGIGCKKHSATIVNYSEIDGEKLFFYNRSTSAMNSMEEQLEEGPTATLDPEIQDTNRDDTEIFHEPQIGDDTSNSISA